MSPKEFEREVLKSKLPVLVDFYATWCGPCQMMIPTIEEIEKEAAGKAKIVKIDIDKNQQLANEYNVMSVPTFLIFKNSEVVYQTNGLVSKQELIKKLTA